MTWSRDGRRSSIAPWKLAALPVARPRRWRHAARTNRDGRRRCVVAGIAPRPTGSRSRAISGRMFPTGSRPGGRPTAADVVAVRGRLDFSPDGQSDRILRHAPAKRWRSGRPGPTDRHPSNSRMDRVAGNAVPTGRLTATDCLRFPGERRSVAHLDDRRRWRGAPPGDQRFRHMCRHGPATGNGSTTLGKMEKPDLWRIHLADGRKQQLTHEGLPCLATSRQMERRSSTTDAAPCSRCRSPEVHRARSCPALPVGAVSRTSPAIYYVACPAIRLGLLRSSAAPRRRGDRRRSGARHARAVTRQSACSGLAVSPDGKVIVYDRLLREGA